MNGGGGGRTRDTQPIPFITLPNWVKAAAYCGFNIEPVFREHGIETDLVHLESVTVSQQVMEQVLETCVARSKRHHFPFVLGETFAFEYLPEIETFLTTSSSLREAARVFDWVRELVNPLVRVRLDERGKTGALVLDLGEGDAAGPAKPWFAETTFASVVKFGRVLLRGHGDFKRLTFRHRAPRYAKRYREFFRLPVAFDQPHDSVELDRRLLDLPLTGAFPTLHQQAAYRVEQKLARRSKPASLAASIEAVFTRKPELLGQGIDQVAAELGLGPRTLQRRLHEGGQGFGELQDRVRCREAMQWLERPTPDIETISERLGFSDRRSFTRAFTRWAGMSPSAFRERGQAK
ncbi:MAG: AraC family transcriptional regulator ligand-binding domain-containing protein [Nevskiales bacterium]